MADRHNSEALLGAHPPQWRWLAAAILLLGCTLHSAGTHAELLFRTAQTINGEQRYSAVRKYSNPADVAYDGGTALAPEEVHAFLSGAITQADVSSAAVMVGLIKNGRQTLAGNAVWLASNGGDIDAGMELGRILRKLGVYTLIGRNDQCLSACVFAFMGGERRSVAGRLGIHRPYFPSTADIPDRQARFRHLQKTLKDFIAEMDFPDSLYEAVMIVPPESMQILSAAELKRFYLEGISPSSEDLADAAAARRLKLSMFDYLARKAKTPACNPMSATQAQCAGPAYATAPNGSDSEIARGAKSRGPAEASSVSAASTRDARNTF
jgi:hypothetical protein